MTLHSEILEQPDVARRLLAAQADNIERIAASLRERLVGEVRRADAAIGEVGLDAGVVHQLSEGGDLLALVARVLGLVDRQANAVAEAGTLGDADLRSNGCAHSPSLSGRADIDPDATRAGAPRSPA